MQPILNNVAAVSKNLSYKYLTLAYLDVVIFRIILKLLRGYTALLQHIVNVQGKRIHRVFTELKRNSDRQLLAGRG